MIVGEEIITQLWGSFAGFDGGICAFAVIANLLNTFWYIFFTLLKLELLKLQYKD